ncbi:hypothetical protein GF324_07500 [bacterium]|nr:hypothetical protein [bacterium]
MDDKSNEPIQVYPGTDDESHPHEGHEVAGDAAGYETSDTNTRTIAITATIITLLIVIFVVFLNEVFVATSENIKYEQILSAENPRLRELQNIETEKLTEYAYIDSAAGVVRIPIDRAMKLYAEEDYKQRNK